MGTKIEKENLKIVLDSSSLRHIDSTSSVDKLSDDLNDYLENGEYLSLLQGQEKWSSVRICDSKKNSVKIENHVSIHSNLNLNGLHPKEVKEVIGANLFVKKIETFDFDKFLFFYFQLNKKSMIDKPFNISRKCHYHFCHDI